MYSGQTVFAQLMDFLPAREFRSMRGALSRQLQSEELLMLGPVSLHGLRAIDVPRESTRYRGLPSETGAKLYHRKFRGDSGEIQGNSGKFRGNSGTDYE